MTFTFTTNDINEAAMVLALFNGQNTLLENSLADKALETPTETPTEVEKDVYTEVDTEVATEVETSIASNDLSAGEIQAVISKLASMTEDELVANFGSENNKPYRVIKNVGLKNAKEKLGTDSVDGVESSVEDIMSAIQVIIKDVSVGGLSHDEMEDMFVVRTSKNLFNENSLDYIVNKLKEEGYI